jgi:uncharacterized protein YjbI with pentapeptide repeats
MKEPPEKPEREKYAQTAEAPGEPWFPTPDELATIRSEHKKWLGTSGKEGKRADLSQAQLRGANFWQANLQGANLSKAQLQGANLSRAQLQGANLSGAQLQEASLWQAKLQVASLSRAKLHGTVLRQAQLQGAMLSNAQLQEADLSQAQLQGARLEQAQLQGANLQGADLRGAILDSVNMEGNEYAGLSPANFSETDLRDASLKDAALSTVTGLEAKALGGANLLGAKLPKKIGEFNALGTVADISARARALFLSAIAACLYSWLTIATTTDAALITNTGSTPLPIIQTQIPIAWFYWVAPGILLALFFYLHLYLQRLWEALASLPAVFPSGRTLYEEAYPWLLSSLVLAFVPNLKHHRPIFWCLQVALSMLAAWVLVPFTIFGYWARYLPRHDLLGTNVITLALVAAACGCVAFWRRAAVTLLEGNAQSMSRNPSPEAFTAFLVLLLASALADTSLSPKGGFEFLGLRSYADLAHAEVSTRPNDWWKLSASERKVMKGVTGARLADSDLRFARAEGAFLAKADLLGANLQGAQLQGADLTDSNVTQEQLNSACGDKATKLPKGLTIEPCPKHGEDEEQRR